MEQFIRFIESIGFEYQIKPVSLLLKAEPKLTLYENSDGYTIVISNSQLKFGKRYSLYFNGEILLRNKEANFALDDLEIIRDRLKCKIRDAALERLLDIYEI